MYGKLNDSMEDELAIRFKREKYWENKCVEFQALNCAKVDKYGQDLVGNLESEEHSVCEVCNKLNKPLNACD